MNWSNLQVWKQSFISTSICLIGCSIGTMGTTYYFMNYNRYLILLASFIAGIISCIFFMVIWDMIFAKMNFKDAFKNSYKMSFVSILIMIITENILILFIAPTDHMHMNTIHSFLIMGLAMGCGFLLALPYNYYQLQKNGNAACHTDMHSKK